MDDSAKRGCGCARAGVRAGKAAGIGARGGSARRAASAGRRLVRGGGGAVSPSLSSGEGGL